MTDAKDLKGGYQVTRSEKHPKGYFVIPEPDRLEDTDFEFLVSESLKVSKYADEQEEKKEPVSSYEFTKMRAVVFAEFIVRCGEWQFPELEYDKFKAKPPANFCYWLVAQIAPYTKLVTDPNDSATS